MDLYIYIIIALIILIAAYLIYVYFFKKNTNSIENNTNLNAEARKTARRKVLEKAARKLEILKSKRNYSSMIAQLEEKLPAAVGRKEDPILRFMREKEIRDRLMGLTERQILSHFGESLFDGSNPLLTDAILNAPSGFEILPEEDLKRLREVRMEKMDPKVAAEIQTVRNLENVIIKMFNLVKNDGYTPEIILGISRGGWIPARLLSDMFEARYLLEGHK